MLEGGTCRLWPGTDLIVPELCDGSAMTLEWTYAKTPKARLEYLRAELRAERISYGELHELQDFAARGCIDPSDLELLEAAGVPEVRA